VADPAEMPPVKTEVVLWATTSIWASGSRPTDQESGVRAGTPSSREVILVAACAAGGAEAFCELAGTSPADPMRFS